MASELSIQKNAVQYRFQIKTLFDRLLNNQKVNGRAPYPQERSWEFGQKAGLKRFVFDPPVYRMETKSLIKAAGLHIGYDKDSTPRTDTFPDITGVPFLTDTSKMGAYSWSLAAGPRPFGGTCPGANVGFMFRDGTRFIKMPNGSNLPLDETERKALMASLRDSGMTRFPRAEDVFEKFICNGCYAIKGRYGAPNIVAAQVWRTLWTARALKDKTFVPEVIEAIRMAQEVSREKRANARTDLELASCGNPAYFRIHDSGDMYSAEYAAAWFEIIRALPDIQFWAPTRIWADLKQAQSILARAGRPPKNLIIRPSSLWFDQPPPMIEWLGPGSTAAEYKYRRIASGEVEVFGPRNLPEDVWMCPAYIPTAMGGGAAPKYVENPRRRLTVIKPGQVVGEPDPGREFASYMALIDPRTGEFVLDSHGRPKKATKKQLDSGEQVGWAQAFAPSGSCELARGPDGEQPCRMCWGDRALDGAIPVSYAKH